MAASDDVLLLTGLDDLYRWNKAAPVGTPVVVTYAFSSAKPAYDSNPRTGFTAFSPMQQAQAKQALEVWAGGNGISFIEVPESAGGQIRFSLFDFAADGIDYAGFAYFPSYVTIRQSGMPERTENSYNGIGGDVFMDLSRYADDASMAPGQGGFSLLLHEIGHALGFKHPFEGTPRMTDSAALGQATLLSYERSRNATELGRIDKEAMQYYYGTASHATEWDPATLTLRQTGTSAGEWILGTELDDIIYGQHGGDTLMGGLGNDELRGGKGHDSIMGGDGNDTIYSGLGRDTLTGGAGDDVFVVRGYDARFPDAVLEPTITDFGFGNDRIGIEGVTASQVASILGAQQSLSGQIGVTLTVEGPKPATITVLGISRLDSSKVFAFDDLWA